jgi:hypothetical protein
LALGIKAGQGFLGQQLTHQGHPLTGQGSDKNALQGHAIDFVQVLHHNGLALRRQAVNFIEDQPLRHISGANFVQHALDLGHLFREIGVGSINNMKQQISVNSFLQSGLKGTHRPGRIDSESYNYFNSNIQ